MNTLTFETDVSDHDKLIGTMLRSIFAKGKPKKIFYRCYKKFDNEELKKHLTSKLDLESSQLAFKTTLNRFAPLKQKTVRNYNQPFVTETLRTATTKISKLRNKFNKVRNAKNCPIANTNKIIVEIF